MERVEVESGMLGFEVQGSLGFSHFRAYGLQEFRGHGPWFKTLGLGVQGWR